MGKIAKAVLVAISGIARERDFDGLDAFVLVRFGLEFSRQSAGYELGDANWAPPSARAYAESAAEEPGRLRIGLALNPPLDGATVDPGAQLM